ncbi:MAG: Fic family protein [Verrucomicrobiota bacterium]
MQWNWQHPNWPTFSYQPERLLKLEAEFLREAGVCIGALKHVSESDKEQLIVELISEEALKTSEIEGEILNRDSLQSSIRRNFGLSTDHRKVPPGELGISRMMVDLYRNFDAPLSDEQLWDWHGMLMLGRGDLADVGCYRCGETPMQVVSGAIHNPKVHFEAPPSGAVPREMAAFVRWFNDTSPSGSTPLPILTRAGLAHLRFVLIHPFEDGNGRIGRAVAEKAISQGLALATLLALSTVINIHRKAYYGILERSNRGLEITEWLIYFAEAVIASQRHTQATIDFLIQKTHFFDRFRGRLNERQEKVVARLFREGPKGFEGGLSAENYIRITETSRATATRDLQDLVDKQALTRTGSLKSTRYHLRIKTEHSLDGPVSGILHP